MCVCHACMCMYIYIYILNIIYIYIICTVCLSTIHNMYNVHRYTVPHVYGQCTCSTIAFSRRHELGVAMVVQWSIRWSCAGILSTFVALVSCGSVWTKVITPWPKACIYVCMYGMVWYGIVSHRIVLCIELHCNVILFVCMYACMHVCMYACLYACMPVCRVLVCVCACVRVPVYWICSYLIETIVYLWISVHPQAPWSCWERFRSSPVWRERGWRALCRCQIAAGPGNQAPILNQPLHEFAWGYNSWVIVTMILECVCKNRNAAPKFWPFN